MLRLLLSGMGTTALIFFVTLALSLPLGLAVAFCRMSKNRILRGITKVYISIMRGTPLMLQLLVVSYGPFFLFKIKLIIYQLFNFFCLTSGVLTIDVKCIGVAGCCIILLPAFSSCTTCKKGYAHYNYTQSLQGRSR